MVSIDKVLDFSELRCPFPIIKTKMALNELSSGTLIRIAATDPAAVDDFKLFCQSTGNALLGYYEIGKQFFFVIMKKF